MIWGYFAGSRVGDLHRVTGTLNQKGYHSILQHHAQEQLFPRSCVVRPKSFRNWVARHDVRLRFGQEFVICL